MSCGCPTCCTYSGHEPLFYHPCVQACSALVLCSVMRSGTSWVRCSTQQRSQPCVELWSALVRTPWSDTRQQRPWAPSAKTIAWLYCNVTAETQNVWSRRAVRSPWTCWSMRTVISSSMPTNLSGYRVKGQCHTRESFHSNRFTPLIPYTTETPGQLSAVCKDMGSCGKNLCSMTDSQHVQ